MNKIIVTAYLVFFCTTMQYITCFDFSFKGIAAWVTGTTQEIFLKDSYFDFDGTVLLENEHGLVTVKSWSLPKIAIEAVIKSPEKDIETIQIIPHITNNKVTINATKKNIAPHKCSIDYHLIVPYKANLMIKNKGNIRIKNVEGNIKAISENSISIRGAVGSLYVQTPANVQVAFATLPLESIVTLASTKGSILLSLPLLSNATIAAKTEFNVISSDHFITLNPMTVVLNKQTWNKVQKEVHGAIGNGGTKVNLSAHNGISIIH